MRTSTRLVPVVAAFAALAACTSGPTGPGEARVRSPERSRFDSGLYMGTGHSVPPSDSVTSSSPSPENRGSGYFGDGN